MTTMLEHLPDQQLLQRLDRGDIISFETLFHRHYDRVYGILFRLVGSKAEAEDLLQEVFLRLYQRPPHDSEREHNVSAWLYRVATNIGYNAIRGRKRQWQRNTILVPPESDPLASPERQVESAETAAAVREALTQLAPQQAQLLILRQMGLSYAELANACELNVNSVGTLLARAARAFKFAYEHQKESGLNYE